jgi:hypothetical protein
LIGIFFGSLPIPVKVTAGLVLVTYGSVAQFDF